MEFVLPRMFQPVKTMIRFSSGTTCTVCPPNPSPANINRCGLPWGKSPPLKAIFPAVAGIYGRRQRLLHPVCRYDLLAAPHSVVEIQISNFCQVFRP